VARPSEPVPPLVQAAQALEDELRLCEKAVAEAVRIRLHSEKNLGRVARELKTAMDHREALGEKVNALLTAITDARGRAEEAARQMEARAGEMQKRLERLTALRLRAGEIGASVREVTEFAAQSKDSGQILERLKPVEERVAQALEEARADDFDDVTGDIAALKEMLATMRRKLESLGR
jgi:chromosome segregation ATPase